MRIANILAAGVCVAALAAGIWHYYDMGRVVLEDAHVAGVVRSVVAPVGAVVGSLKVRQGDTVAPGDELLRLVAPGRGDADAMPHADGASHQQHEREAHAAWQAATKVEEGVRRQLELRSTEHARALVVLRGMRADASVAYATLQRAERDEREARKAYDAARKSAEDASTLRAEAEAAWRTLREGRQMAVSQHAVARVIPVVHVVRAEASGTVTGVLVREGATVTTGQPLLEMTPTSAADLWVVGCIPKGREASVRKGMVCSLRLDGVPGDVRGRVVSLEDGIRPSTEDRSSGAARISSGEAASGTEVVKSTGAERLAGTFPSADEGDHGRPVFPGTTSAAPGTVRNPAAGVVERGRGTAVWARVVPDVPASSPYPLWAGGEKTPLRYGATAGVVILVREPHLDGTPVQR